MIEVSKPPIRPEALLMESTCSCRVADVICRTVELGVSITGASFDSNDVTVIETAAISAEGFCPTCGAEGILRDHVIRELVDIPVAGHPTRLRVRVGRFRCVHDECEQKIFQQQLGAAAPGAKTTRRCTKWILQRLAIDKMSVTAVAKALGLGWDVVNKLACNAARDLVYDEPTFLGRVRVLGVDEHTWRHTHTSADNFVTILVDLTPAMDGTGPSRLLDVRQGRSAKVLATWLSHRSIEFKAGIKVVGLLAITPPPGSSFPTRLR